MIEKIIKIREVEPSIVFGTNNERIDLIDSLSPKIKLIARGDSIKIKGNEESINHFEKRFSKLVTYLSKYNALSNNHIEEILKKGSTNIPEKDTVIIYGLKGRPITVKTKNQNKLLNEIERRDLILAIGPAGTGKTYTSVAIAMKFLKEKRVKKIILTRPAIEAGENLGFLPGDLKEKIDPYMQPIYDAFFDIMSKNKLDKLIEKDIIQISPLAFMRGRTLENAFVILDEGQNTTEQQMKMFLTRMGVGSKFIITGDDTQVDLPKNYKSGLINAKKILKNISDISIINLNERDVIRHKIVKKIINAYNKK